MQGSNEEHHQAATSSTASDHIASSNDTGPALESEWPPMPCNAGGGVCSSKCGGTRQHSTQLALSHQVECFSIDAGEQAEEPQDGSEADWWQGVEEAMMADVASNGFFAHSPVIVDLTDPRETAPRRRIRSKRPATPDVLGAPLKKRRHPG